ncbi:MAG: peptidylprolyl isomerase [Ignavibacteria bacterium]|nr:peptidylprolyl isomerase [Ignavibacteria bacterium]
MKRKYSASIAKIFLLVFFVLLAAGCSKKDKSVIAELGDEDIYLYEFEEQILKTTPNPDSLKAKSFEEKNALLKQYINYRLKVKDARDRGLDTLPDIKNDLQEFKKNIYLFLINKEVVYPQIEKLYDRKKYEYKVSHILVNLPPKDVKPEDSLRAYLKIDSIISKLSDKEEFSNVAKQFSEDGSVVNNGGELGYITGGMTVTEFEDAVYSLGVGNYTKTPVRTQFGLHIIKVTDKRKSVESVRASHILFQEKRDSLGAAIDSMEVLEKALKTLERLKNGEEFESVAKEVSDDIRSSQRGGDIGHFNKRQVPPAIDSALSELKIGEHTGLVRSQMGWHILKLTEIKEFPEFEKMQESLKSEFMRTEGYVKALKEYTDKIKEKYKFELMPDAITFFTGRLDSTQTFGSLNLDSIFTIEDMSKVIATFENGEIKAGDIIQYLKTSATFSGRTPVYRAIEELIENGSQPILFNYVAIEEDYDESPEYTAQILEYENGLLKFKIEQEEINSKIKLTEEDLQKFYSENISKYTMQIGDSTVTKAFEDVRGEISNELQQQKAKELDNAFIDNLKLKYPVVIHNDVVEKSFTKL